MRRAPGGGLVARRRPQEAPEPGPGPAGPLPFPEALSALRCVEVWVPEWSDLDDLAAAAAAWCRWRNAANAWRRLHAETLAAHPGSRPRWLTGGGRPWSFDYLAEHDPRRLADKIAGLGLPAEWTPTPAPKILRSLSNCGDPSPEAVGLLAGQ